jgi:hypothetical protein
MLPEPRPDEWLRHLAREMNLSAPHFWCGATTSSISDG